MLFKEISYKEIVASLAERMSANFADFSADRACFNETVSQLEREVGETPVAQAVAAIDQRVGSVVLFSYFLGLKANWDHFMNPIGRAFLDVDAEVYLREDMVKWLPDYQNAVHIQQQFYGALSPAQQDRYADVMAYICHLETVGPKLAHYDGYMLGNQLFPRIIPGYEEDLQLTLRYRQMLENYFGNRF